MDKSKIKAGDVVQLKSGGVKMTVGTLNSENTTAYCYWFAGLVSQSSYFSLITLKKVKGSK